MKPLFAGTDMKRQKTMLLGTLVLLRKSLRDLDAIVPKLHELGARHIDYGAQPEHYPVVGQALVETMAEVARTGVAAPNTSAPGAPLAEGLPGHGSGPAHAPVGKVDDRPEAALRLVVRE